MNGLASRFLAFAFITIYFSIGMAPLSFASDGCRATLEVLNTDFVLADGVAVTGEFIYDLDFVLKNLGLNEVNLSSKLSGKTVISLAEGISGLLPYLVGLGVNIRAIDLWYEDSEFPNNFSGREMRNYISSYGEFLEAGDATNLSRPDNSVDVVLSHMLVNNVDIEVQKKVISEVVRVLSHGGEARIYGFGESDVLLLRDLFTENYEGIDFDFLEISNTLTFRGNTSDHDGHLLIIRKPDLQ